MLKSGSAAPTPSLAVLSETVDLLGVVVAKMSEKLDQHGETLAAVQKTALESRDAAQAAKACVVTQMGTQMHAQNNFRRVVELIQTGAIGPVREVHVWVSRAWGDGGRQIGRAHV